MLECATCEIEYVWAKIESLIIRASTSFGNEFVAVQFFAVINVNHPTVLKILIADFMNLSLLN